MEKTLSILEYDANFNKDHIIICYKGPFLSRVLALIGEKITLLINDDPLVSKKVFSIFLEMAQNVAYYSEDRSTRNNIPDPDKTIGKGTFLITETDSHYTISSANLIKKSWEQEILDKCALVNSLDVEGLRKLKRELRSQPKKQDHVGGNIGLVDIALKASAPLQVDITHVNELHSYFVISIQVGKAL
jgi:hypothetical protein